MRVFALTQLGQVQLKGLTRHWGSVQLPWKRRSLLCVGRASRVAPGSSGTFGKEIQRAVREAIKRFWAYGLRGADLIVTCYGPRGWCVRQVRTRLKRGMELLLTSLSCWISLVPRSEDAIAGEFRGDNLVYALLRVGQPLWRQ